MMTLTHFAKHCSFALTLLTSANSVSLANDTIRDCDPEPTDMTIAYGNFMIGDNCIISGGGEVDLFRFNGSAGDNVVLSLGDGSSSSSINPCFEVRDAANQVVVPNTCAPDDGKWVEELSLPASGSYLVLVREDSNDAVSYGLSLDRMVPPTLSSDPICYGCEVSSDITSLGDVDFYLLSAIAGDQILVTLIDRNSSSSINPCMSLRNPDGTPTPNGTQTCAPDDGATTIEETIAESGVYTIMISEDSAAGVAFGLDVQCLVGPCVGSEPLITSALDVDGNGAVNALTDGLLLIRYMFGFRDGALIDGAVADDCRRCTSAEIEAYIERVENTLLVDQVIPLF
jgi:hypothetical protein